MALRGKKDQLKVRTKVALEGDNGKTEQFKFTSLVRVVEVDQWHKDWERAVEDDEYTETDLIGDYYLGWENLKGDDGEPIEYNDENLAEALEIREYRVAILRAVVEANGGRAVLNAKN